MPSGHPYSIIANTVTPTSLNISWTPPDPSQWNGVIQYYIIYVTQEEPMIRTSVYTRSSTFLTISGLQPYTLHEVKVAAVTIDSGPNTTAHIFRTEEDGTYHFKLHTIFLMFAFLLSVIYSSQCSTSECDGSSNFVNRPLGNLEGTATKPTKWKNQTLQCISA